MRYGRINRVSYWLGLFLATGFSIVLGKVGHQPSALAGMLLIIFAIPRLHDIGKSAWWAGFTFILANVIAAIALFVLPPSAASITFVTVLLVVYALLIWLGAVRGDPEPNRFGDPPPIGLSLSPWRSISDK